MTKGRLFWPLLLSLVLADCGSKRIAESSLSLHAPREVVGDVVRFTLGYNPGAAFGMHVGSASRSVFTVLGLLVLGAIGYLYRATPADRRWELVGLALVAGGAIGNLIDRVWAGQVVDFIDVGIGAARFWTFNLADAGITLGAAILVFALLREPVVGGQDGSERETEASAPGSNGG
jgi:signal peptidase II